jgi:TolB-like protein/tRNA A-37 threonylcarbamoyl transferase component Bud32
MIGQTISHYKILEKLGGGGMGVVYKAEDIRLKRTVALKFLPPELTRDEDAKTRFVHEAQAASALQHNNICTIHEIDETQDGQVFIAMDCYEGETLKQKIARGPLPVEDAINFASQVARGLARAHAAGVIHRDIKPANIIVTSDGTVKILDFGLAKLEGRTKVTKTGMTVGTVAYMSPEQAKGEGVDQRTDVWSLGVILYEMLTGKTPFRGEVEPAIVYSILNEDPKPVTSLRSEVPMTLEGVVERALAKDTAKRYQTIDEMVAALDTVAEESRLGIERKRHATLVRLKRRKRLIAGSALVVVIAIAAFLIATFHERGQAIDSIAVMPFENLSRDPEKEYYSDGLTVLLINELGKIGAIRVVSRRSAMQFKDTDKTLPEIAEALNVKAIVEGSILRSGDQLEITAQLIRANPERQMWAESYRRHEGDVLILLGEVAQAIAREIQVALTPDEQTWLVRTRPVNPEAYDFYLKGMDHSQKWTRAEMKKAIDCFRRAVEIDSNYAEAYAAMAGSYVFFGYYGMMSKEEARSKADALVRKSLEINDMLPEAHLAAGGIKHYYEWDWVGAEREYRLTLALDPNRVEAHWEYSLLLTCLGRFREAIAEAKRAQQLDPLWFWTSSALISAYYHARRYGEAVAECQGAIERWPERPVFYVRLQRAYTQMGRYESAIKTRHELGALLGTSSEMVAALDSAYTESGPDGYWRWRLQSIKGKHEQDPYSTARIYAQLGDKDHAFAWLEKAYERRDGQLLGLRAEPMWDPLRDDPRFQNLVRRMNYPE